VYDRPLTFFSQSILKQQKRADALNIFVVNTIDSPAFGQTLAIYSNRANTNAATYSDDWITIIKSEFKPYKEILTRTTCEFFGLVRTNFGVDCLSFSISDTTICYSAKNCNPISDREFERVARTGSRANCATAGDGFCDTPADYGFDRYTSTTSPCTYTGKIKDEDCVLLAPDVNNIMGYNLGCMPYAIII
jgi:hypothetical protein